MESQTDNTDDEDEVDPKSWPPRPVSNVKSPPRSANVIRNQLQSPRPEMKKPPNGKFLKRMLETVGGVGSTTDRTDETNETSPPKRIKTRSSSVASDAAATSSMDQTQWERSTWADTTPSDESMFDEEFNKLNASSYQSQNLKAIKHRSKQRNNQSATSNMTSVPGESHQKMVYSNDHINHHPTSTTLGHVISLISATFVLIANVLYMCIAPTTTTTTNIAGVLSSANAFATLIGTVANLIVFDYSRKHVDPTERALRPRMLNLSLQIDVLCFGVMLCTAALQCVLGSMEVLFFTSYAAAVACIVSHTIALTMNYRHYRSK